MVTNSFPIKIGYDLSGTIISVGSEVASSRPDLKPGVEVYSRVPEDYRGTVSEYALSTASATALKLASLSHIEAASIPLASLTSLQVLDLADSQLNGGLKGKTVYIPGGLSATGSVALQLAKHVFKAGKVVTTVSTAKVPKVDELLGKGVVDQIIDYTKEDPSTAIAPESVDFMFDTMGQAMPSLHLMKKGAMIITVTPPPFGPGLRGGTRRTRLPVRLLLEIIGAVGQYRASRRGVDYRWLGMHPSAEDLARINQWIEEGIFRPVVGRVAKFDNLQDVRDGCQQVFSGKGGVGKFVIEIGEPSV